MALAFSNSADGTGLVELLSDLTNTTAASTSSYSLKKKTRDINSAYAQFMMLAIRASGKWQMDDTNQTDYPIIKMNLVSGQQDYPLLVDGSTIPNQILDVQRVECATDSTATKFSVLEAYDQTDETMSLQYLATLSGIPTRYDKLANGIFLDRKPNFSATNGLYVYFSRTPVYFLSTDTTKTAGIPDFFHEYLVYRPAYLFCAAKGLDQAPAYLAFLTKMERDIAQYYSGRDRDEHRFMTSQPISFR
jgi:hypothetical protein